MKVIAKACLSEHARKSLLKLLGNVNESCFLKTVFVEYLANIISSGKGHDFDEELIRTALLVFKNLVKTLPSKSMPIVTLLVTQIKIAAMLAIPRRMVEDAVREIEDVLADNQKQLQLGCLMRDQEEAQSMSWDPGEQFRRMSVVPTSQDLHGQKDPHLSKNIIFGKYKSVNQYLDVQFRLLREDFLRPLREGLTELLEWKRLGSNYRVKTDLKLYNRVQIISPNFGKQGLIYKINFDMKHLQHVDWEGSKRLTNGSLICLSSDQFKTILVATVAEREVASIKRGEIHILFQNEDSKQPTELRLDILFEMFESPAFFEAYQPVLEALQYMDENSLPFIKYLLNQRGQDEAVAAPLYLLKKKNMYNFASIIPSCSMKETSSNQNRDSTKTDFEQKYNIEPTIQTSSMSEMGSIHGKECPHDHEYDFEPIVRPCSMSEASHLHRKVTSNAGNKYTCDPRNLENWPTAEQLGLDNSQCNALKSALTTEFSLIQGPPGTGKTFIGLKIVQVLLANEQAWNLNDKRRQPILIVCCTNHALDQFLELILDSKLIEKNEDLVRIGARSKSEKLKCHLIKEIKYKARFRYGGNRHDRMWKLESDMMSLAAYIELSKEQIFYESVLQRYMTPSQEKSLLSRKRSAANESIFLLWLINNNSQSDPIQELPTNADISDEKKVEPKIEYGNLEEDDWEVNENGTIRRKKPNYENAKSRKLFCGDFLVENSGENCNKLEQLRIVYRTFRESMSEPETKCINVWTLTSANRWRLYNYWVSQHVGPRIQRLADLLVEHNIEMEVGNEISKEEDYQVMRSAKIIGMTTTGSAKCRDVLQRVQPRIVIVEEAAEVLEAHIVTSLSKGCEHLILIGDHQQLRPNPAVYQLAKDYHLNISLFERMVLNELHCDRLSIQHRMRPEIAELIVPHIYTSLTNANSVLLYENVWGILGNIFFLNHSFNEEKADDRQSHSNIHEAKFLSALCKYFLDVGYKPSQITILTTYSGQMFLFSKYMPKTTFEGVHVTPVDNYQGEENDIILLSLVRSNKDGNIGFLNIANRVCVALSRARKGCFIIGNGNQLADGSRLWHNILASMKTHNRVVDSLPLACHKHPETVTKVSSENDFQLVPHGGCSIPCEYRLDCGHVCHLNCHPFDHSEYKCLKSCTRSCPFGHPCEKQCFIQCGNCQVLVQKTLSRCQHTHRFHCYVDEKYLKCKIPCPKSCTSGHPCKKLCFDDCGNCKVLVEKILPRCQHTSMVPCYMPADKFKCEMICKTVCPNGHPCSQLCHEECKPCVVPVEKEISRCHHLQIVPCHVPERIHKCVSSCIKCCPSNHPCVKLCYEQCGTCSEPCKKVCRKGHPCVKFCGENCGQCQVAMDKVLPRCKHVKRMPCCKPRAFAACSSPCEKLLKCGHSCTNLCGKTCTMACQVVVPDIMLPCLHKASLPCSMEPKTHQCLEQVELTLCVNEHLKIVPCYRSSLIKEGKYECDAWMKISSTCNSVMKHELEITCHQQTSGSLAVCRSWCNFEQSCGHRCRQECRWCTTSKKHQFCNKKCLRRLPFCSHPCSGSCFEKCLPCSYNCSQSCIHGQCNHRCSEPCTPCRKPCAWTCQHHACSLTCSEPCTRPVCAEPCKRKLTCKHACQGLCGEPCLDRCFTCRPNEILELEKALQGFTIYKSTRFVQLRPCGDVIPVGYMDDWVKQSTRNPICAVGIRQQCQNLTLKGFLCIICPLEHCKQEVKYCPRYNTQIKRLSLSQSVAKSKIRDYKKNGLKFDNAKDQWVTFSRNEGFPIQMSYSSLEFYVLWLWNECQLQTEAMSRNLVSSSYVNICKNIKEEQELIENVRLGDVFETCRNVIGLSRLYMLMNVVKLSLVTRGPKLGVLDKCFKSLSSANVDSDAEKTWMNVLTVNEMFKQNFTQKPADRVVDLNELFESETSVTYVHSEWISCTKGLSCKLLLY